jgi:hypothetical protein
MSRREITEDMALENIVDGEPCYSEDDRWYEDRRSRRAWTVSTTPPRRRLAAQRRPQAARLQSRQGEPFHQR